MTTILDKLATEVDKLESTKQTKSVIADENVPSVMEDLLQANELHYPKVNDVVEGIVLEVSSNAIYLDIEPFGTGIVLGREIKDGMLLLFPVRKAVLRMCKAESLVLPCCSSTSVSLFRSSNSCSTSCVLKYLFPTIRTIRMLLLIKSLYESTIFFLF